MANITSIAWGGGVLGVSLVGRGGTDLALWSASSPRGPFADPEVVGRLVCSQGSGELRYMPLAHPELLPRPGTVVISWSRNNQDLATVCGDPRLYRPHFARLRRPEDGPNSYDP